MEAILLVLQYLRLLFSDLIHTGPVDRRLEARLLADGLADGVSVALRRDDALFGLEALGHPLRLVVHRPFLRGI